MKKYIKSSLKSLCLALLFMSCNKILDKTPLDKYSDAAVFKDVNLAERYLLDSYGILKSSFSEYLLPDILTDDMHDTQGFARNYLFGSMVPENLQPWDGQGRGQGLVSLSWVYNYQYIQKLNIFLSRIDEVLNEYSPADKIALKANADDMKGQALFLRAYGYTQLVRSYGGVPLFKTPYKLGDDFFAIKRSTFEETIKFISDDLDAAAALLKVNGKQGMASKGAALALKSRVLLFAASDLTADGNPSSPDPNNFISYKSPNRPALWAAARAAAKAVIDMNYYILNDWGSNKATISQKYYELFNERTLANKEFIWGKMHLNGIGAQFRANRFHGSNGFDDYGCAAPTQELVNSYQMDDGSDFTDHFMLDGANKFVNISGKYTSPNPYMNRDPRLTGSILYDGAKWRDRPGSLQSRDPLGVYDRRTRIITQGGVEISRVFGIDTKNGPVDAEDGTYTGYVMKKHLDITLNSNNSNNENVWVELRYAEVLLNYAEASIMVGDNAEAAKYINMVRNRAGLPDFVGDIMKALKYERRAELSFENSRWYDLRRWKIFENSLKDPKGMSIIQTTNNDNGVVTVTWEQILSEARPAATKRMYWAPISNSEMQKAPQLIQTPGY